MVVTLLLVAEMDGNLVILLPVKQQVPFNLHHYFTESERIDAESIIREFPMIFGTDLHALPASDFLSRYPALLRLPSGAMPQLICVVQYDAAIARRLDHAQYQLASYPLEGVRFPPDVLLRAAVMAWAEYHRDEADSIRTGKPDEDPPN